MTGAGAATVAEICVVACAEAWRGDGAILASPMGLIPALGARLAQLTFEPDLLLTDGEAALLAPAGGQPPIYAQCSGALSASPTLQFSATSLIRG